ncbi:MAG: hypothetical protein GXY07_00970 [Candidatus Hydrogenedentes bacterium]|jgi:parvulin-like peptidyl-prolyl isomerase|nr:hypothetical protein [Candidatus Hydrogenedentota bacterium]
MDKCVFRYLGLVLLTAAGPGTYVCAQQAFTDGIVAIVAGEPILRSDIMQEILPKMQEVSASATREEIESQLEPLFQESLEQAIEHFILYKEAKTLGVEISDADVEKHIADVRKQYDSTESYQKALGTAGYTMSDFRERMRRQMMAITVSMSKRRQFEREAVVTESDLEEYYKDNQEQYQFSSQYRVRRIFLTASGNEDEKKAVHDQLTAFRKQIMEGSDFAELARQHSQGPEASEGGMMGWVKPGDLVEPLGSALTRLKAGDVSDVLETEFGLHLLRVEEYKSEGIMSFEEARTEIEPILRRQQGEKRYRQWMSTLRKRNNVKVLL